MNLQPISGTPALKFDGTLVIGDLHIGLESHLLSKGFRIITRTWDMLDSISAASEDCERLIILGDIKDSVPGTSKQEYREIPAFFDRLLEYFNDVDVVRGNHDTNIEEFLPDRVRIRPASGLKVGEVGLVHGHTWPSADVMGCDTLVLAHDHPAVMFRDGVGKITTEPCWLRGRFIMTENERFGRLPSEFIVVPAFNRMLGGSPVNVRGEPLLGPMLNSDMIDLDSARVYLLNGMDLGRRGDLLLDGRDRSRWKRK